MALLPAGPSVPMRYDELHAKKFDHGKRISPDTAVIANHGLDTREVREQDPYGKAGLKGLRIADVSLKARNQVGLLIGSLAQDMDGLAPETDLGKHRDVDVLILNPFDKRHPAPMEGGIDWWVRPPAKNGEPERPTNGKVALWFDVGLKPGAHIQGMTQSKLFNRQSSVTSIEQESIVLPAGLYRPESKTMEQIVDHVTKSAGYLRASFEMASTATKMWEVNYRSHQRQGLLSAARRIEKLFCDIARQVHTTMDSPRLTEVVRTKEDLLNAFYILQRQQSEAEGWVRKFAKDYSYLLLRDNTEKELIPTLPDSLVDFSPLGNV